MSLNKFCSDARLLFKFNGDAEGASLIEMAVVTPFLFILILGILEFGNVLYQHQLISSGIRDAGRYLARWNDNDITTNDCGALPTTVEDTAKQIAVTGSPSGGDKRVDWWNVGDISITYATTPAIDSGTGARLYSEACDDVTIIQVTTTVSYTGLGFLDFLGLGQTLDFTMSHEERRIR
jgi:Flp pilus assembly protein TadG